MSIRVESPTFNFVPKGIERSLEGVNLDPALAYSRDFSLDLSQIRPLQHRWNEALGLNISPEQSIRSYNPVLARWKYERLPTEAAKEAFRGYELQQLNTALRERYQSSESVINYRIGKDGELYNELFPDEPFINVLRRGLAYRKEQGSPEVEREEAEVEGWLKMKTLLADSNSPLGSRITIISGPGLIEGTNYKDNFVDVYEAAKDPQTGERIIKMTRRSSAMNYGEYYNELARINPELIKNISGPFDAVLLKTLLPGEITIREKGIDEVLMSQINRLTLPWKLRYLDALCSEPFNPRLVADAFNDLLRVGDLIKSGKHEHVSAIQIGDVEAAAGFIRNLPIALVAAGCGMSGGFGLGEGLGGMASNSVARFGIMEDEYGSLRFECPHCHSTNTRPRGGFKERCDSCNGSVRC